MIINKNEKNFYYKFLGVEPTATKKEIKKAYRKKAGEYHPDINPEGEELFLILGEAYDVLTNDINRKEYDEKQVGEVSRETLIEKLTPTYKTNRDYSSIKLDMKLQKTVLPIIGLADLDLISIYTGTQLEIKNMTDDSIAVTVPRGLTPPTFIGYGDNVVKIELKDLEGVRRKGDNLLIKSTIKDSRIKLDEKHLKIKDISIDLAEGKKKGKKLVFTGHGFYNIHKKTYGDLIIE